MSTGTNTPTAHPPPIEAYSTPNILTALAGTEVGGGVGFPDEQRVTEDETDETVRTAAELRSALGKVGRKVWLPEAAAIDLTGESPIYLARDATLASNRGVDGSAGGLLYTRSKGRDSALWRGQLRTQESATDVTITGLRFRGPQYEPTRTDGRPPGYLQTNQNQDPHYARGINLLGARGTVSNCELYGWTGTAVSTGARGVRPFCEITHNYIHDNMMVGYGYGASVKDGHPRIAYNYFDNCRHAVDGFGYHTCGYDCEDNVFGPHTLSHHVDMHCLVENGSGGSSNRAATNYDLRAGGRMRIRRNTFVNVRNIEGGYSQAIVIRGYPYERCDIERNRFHNIIAGPEPVGNVRNTGRRNVPYRQPNIENPRTGWHGLHFADNQYGPSAPYRADTGAPVDLGARILAVEAGEDLGPSPVSAPAVTIPFWADTERRTAVSSALRSTSEALESYRMVPVGRELR